MSKDRSIPVPSYEVQDRFIPGPEDFQALEETARDALASVRDHAVAITATVDQIKAIREATGEGLFFCKQAFGKTGSVEGAIGWLRGKIAADATARAALPLKEGRVHAYTHADRIGVVVELRCDTDFLARTDEFNALLHGIALHIAADSSGLTLTSQVYLLDETVTVGEAIANLAAKAKENVRLGRHHRIALDG